MRDDFGKGVAEATKASTERLLTSAERFKDSLGRSYRERPGRKPRGEEAADSGVCIRLTAEERADLEAVAQENQCSLTDLLRDAVNSFVADYRETPVFRRQHPQP